MSDPPIDHQETQRLATELNAEKQKRVESKLKRSWFGMGLLWGVVIGMALVAAPVFLVIKPKTDELEKLLTEQRDTCQAKFSRVTVLWDLSGGSAQRIHLMNGLVDLVPGSVLGGDQPRPAWFIPADVEPIFYGDANQAVVLRINKDGKIISRQLPRMASQVAHTSQDGAPE